MGFRSGIGNHSVPTLGPKDKGLCNWTEDKGTMKTKISPSGMILTASTTNAVSTEDSPTQSFFLSTQALRKRDLSELVLIAGEGMAGDSVSAVPKVSRDKCTHPGGSHILSGKLQCPEVVRL